MIIKKQTSWKRFKQTITIQIVPAIPVYAVKTAHAELQASKQTGGFTTSLFSNFLKNKINNNANKIFSINCF
jgi:hypothetical protein